MIRAAIASLGILLLSACASSARSDQPCTSNTDCEDDNLYCNGGVVCRDGACVPTDPPNCADGIACTVDSCSEELVGCINVPHSELCAPGLACLDGVGCGVPPQCEFAADCGDDGYICNGSPDCIAGMCQEVPLDCNDTNNCTADACVEGPGCTHTPYDTQHDVDHCGATCMPCPDPSPLQVNTMRDCNNSVCGFVCLPGYWDVNNNMADGCEVTCATNPNNTPDTPDDSFLDQNCDGIDGTVVDGVFVAEDGSNANPGTMQFPVKNINTGIAKALAAGKHFVYISAGDYNETVTLDATNQGIGLYGGYLRSSAWLRDGTRGSVVGPRTGSLRVNSVTTSTTVEFLQFIGATATVPSTSSHAIVVTSSTGFVPRHLLAISGSGATGLMGASAGAGGDDGGDGQIGTNGYEDDSYFYCAGNQTDPAATYAGGQTCVGGSTAGGLGRRGCKTNGGDCAGGAGDPGGGDPAGFWSDGGIPVSGGAGGVGQVGLDGAAGTNGGAGAGGSISGTEWVPRNGNNGLRGVDGSGGGGGAGGGSTHSTGTCNDWGGGGGGGGGGGCGGGFGDGGTGGGGSIAIVLINSTVTAYLVEATTGNAGNGGVGRDGGSGGPGGTGGSGGAGNDEGRSGGAGGHGGHAGRGGHGGGGAGGWVVGVYRSGSTWTDGGTTTATLGTVGLGGGSSGNSGATGSAYAVY